MIIFISATIEMEMAKLLASTILLAFPAVVLNRPTGQQMVDLSYIYDNSTISWLTVTPFQMIVTQNGTNEDGIWFQFEDIFSSTHAGTHMDSPCHFVPGRWTVEQIPLTHLVAPAAVVDITDRAATDPDAVLLVSDLENWEQRWDRTLDDTIVIMRSGWGRRWPNREAYTGTPDRNVSRIRFPGVSSEAAQWLVQNRNIYGVGVDTISLDSGIDLLKGALAHITILGANIYGLENMANLEKLPECGAQLHVSPMRIGGDACGSPTRVTAFLP